MPAAGPPLGKDQWSEALFRALTRHSHDVISLLDPQGRLVFNSEAAERISGFTLEELAGADTFELIHPDDRAAVGAVFQAILAAPGAIGTVVYRYRNRAGGFTWMEAVARNLLHDPEVRGVVANSRDITERRRLEAERQAIEGRLVQAQQLEGLATLAGGVAHDFNNLLVGILGAVDVARAELLEGHPAREPLRIASEASLRAAALCRQLLTFAGRAEPRLEPIRLGDLVAETAELLGASAGRKVELRQAVAPDLPGLSGDPVQLRQVLLNLVVNAAEAADGAGTIALTADVVEADRAMLDGLRLGEALAPGRWVRLRVSDHGRGMTPEVLARIFDPFFTTKQAGRGLGLAATLGVVRRHGGGLQVESAPGRGTTFTILLPPAAAPPPATARPPATDGWRGHGLALVADDEVVVRRVARRMLEAQGFQVEEASDGEEAAQAVERGPGRFALVLLDLTMPRLDGLGALRRIRGAAPALPVIISTGHAPEDSRARVGAAGAAAMLEKPYDLATMRRVVRAALGQG